MHYNQLQEYFEGVQYLGEAIDYIHSMGVEVKSVNISCDIATLCLGVGGFRYRINVYEGFGLYTVVRALYKPYDEGTEAENDILRNALANLLYKYIAE